jgi:signal transduction histidine kinase
MNAPRPSVVAIYKVWRRLRYENSPVAMPRQFNASVLANHPMLINSKSLASVVLASLTVVAVLTEGAAAALQATLFVMPTATSLMLTIVIKLMGFGICSWYVSRFVTKPLAQITAAANALGPNFKTPALTTEGVLEPDQAKQAFNAMQLRLASYVAERIEVLAAISHDLQTPITRMQLRCELLDNEVDRQKFLHDLEVMKDLVREGVTYARTLHGITESPRRVDVDALLDSIVADYCDSGQNVVRTGSVGEMIVTRPNAVRRILMNLIDNALKFGTVVRVETNVKSNEFVLAIKDNGPGIPSNQLEAVFKPFYQVEASPRRHASGTGLGLAIAYQLAIAMGADLQLRNGNPCGLEARLTLSIPTHRPKDSNSPTAGSIGELSF